MCPEIVWQTLIAGGANIEARDNRQRTSLMIATQCGRTPVLEVRPCLESSSSLCFLKYLL